MYYLSSNRRSLVAVLLIIILAAALAGCSGLFGPASPAVSTRPAGPTVDMNSLKIVVVPPVVDLKAKTIDIYGSGFTPGTTISIGIPGVPKSTKLETAKDLWFDSVTANKYGGFATTVDLSQSLFSLVSTKVLTEKEVLGVYSVVALDAKGNMATAPLAIVAPPPAVPAK